MNNNIISRIILLMLLITGTASAQEVNKLYIGDLRAMKNLTFDMPVYVENTNPNIVAAQMEVRVPYGMELDINSVSTNAQRTGDHRLRTTCLSSATGEGEYSSYRLMLISPTNRPLKANKGQVFTVQATIASSASFEEGKNYPIYIDNPVLSDSLGNNVLTEYEGGNLFIEANPDFVVENVRVGNATYMPGDSIEVSWNVRNQGSADSHDGWSEQVFIVPNQSNQTINLGDITRYNNALAKGVSMPRGGKFALPRIPGFADGFKVMVKITPFSTSGELPQFQTNNSTVSTDDCTMGRLLYLTGNNFNFTERSSRGYFSLERSGSTATEESFTISKTGDGRLTLPEETIIFAKGSPRTSFYITINNDALFNESDAFNVKINSANGYEGLDFDVTI